LRCCFDIHKFCYSIFFHIFFIFRYYYEKHRNNMLMMWWLWLNEYLAISSFFLQYISPRHPNCFSFLLSSYPNMVNFNVYPMVLLLLRCSTSSRKSEGQNGDDLDYHIENEWCNNVEADTSEDYYGVWNLPQEKNGALQHSSPNNLLPKSIGIASEANRIQLLIPLQHDSSLSLQLCSTSSLSS